jgi:hypothetical protein
MLKRCLWNLIVVPIGAIVLGYLPLLVVALADVGLMSGFLSYWIFWLTTLGMMIIIVLFFSDF